MGGALLNDLPAVFQDLRMVLASCAERLDTRKDTDTEFHVDTRHIQANGTPLFFGAVQLLGGVTVSGSLLAGTLSVAVFPLLSALAGATMAAGLAWAYNLAASRSGLRASPWRRPRAGTSRERGGFDDPDCDRAPV